MSPISVRTLISVVHFKVDLKNIFSFFAMHLERGRGVVCKNVDLFSSPEPKAPGELIV